MSLYTPTTHAYEIQTTTEPLYPNTVYNSNAISPVSSATSLSSQEDPFESLSTSQFSYRGRPQLQGRRSSITSIIPKSSPRYQSERPVYPPNDARGMSPRRSEEDIRRMEASARKSLQDHAQTLQSSLSALADRIDEVKQDHDKLETENRFLQEYIGGLTRNVAKEPGLARSGSTKVKRGKK